MDDTRFAPKILLLTGGFLVWAAHFVAVYVFAALVCEKGLTGETVFGYGLLPTGVVALTLLYLGACAILGWRAWRFRTAGFRGEGQAQDTSDFLRFVAVTGVFLSMLAILWEGLLVLPVPACT